MGCIVCSVKIPAFESLGPCCICCGTCLDLAVIIVTGVYRYSEVGKACAESQTPIFKWCDATYSEVGHQMQSMFIAQVILFPFYTFYVHFIV